VGHQDGRKERQAERSVKPLQELQRARLHFLHGPCNILNHLDRLAPFFRATQKDRQRLDRAVRLELGDDRLLADESGAPIGAK
jgi:hypothetical protein